LLCGVLKHPSSAVPLSGTVKSHGTKESALFERETQADFILTIFVWRRVCSSRLFKHLLLLPRWDDSLVALTKTGDLTRKDRIVRICGEKQGVSGRYYENTGQLFC
jgi:hypothetical protein